MFSRFRNTRTEKTAPLKIRKREQRGKFLARQGDKPRWIGRDRDADWNIQPVATHTDWHQNYKKDWGTIESKLSSRAGGFVGHLQLRPIVLSLPYSSNQIMQPKLQNSHSFTSCKDEQNLRNNVLYNFIMS